MSSSIADITFEEALLKIWEFNDLTSDEVDLIVGGVMANAHELIGDPKEAEDFECFCGEVADMFME